MLFFQIGLLCGYTYAHLLASRVPLARQPYIHIFLIILSLVALPLTPVQPDFSTSEQNHIANILVILATSIGLPFVILSASAPLLQHWFANVFPNKSPFRLYALSNLGSLVALLTYPVLVEPALALSTQTNVWSASYLFYGGVIVWCAWPILSKQAAASTDDVPARIYKTTLGDRFIWVALATCGATVLLAITNQMCQDVAVIPFLWVVPLSLYLLTFIICFDHDRWYFRPVWIPAFLVSVAGMVGILYQDYEPDIPLLYQIAIYSLALFTCCMVCHGEMVRRRPPAGQLTTFYLFVALGGAMGGVFVSLVAPIIFDGFWELHIGLLASALLVGWCIYQDRKVRGSRAQQHAFAVSWSAALLVLAFYLYSHMENQLYTSIENSRNFFGVLHIYDKEGYRPNRSMYHGRIEHGSQWLSERDRHRPTTYYGTFSGAGIAIELHPKRSVEPVQSMKVGVIGLGIGTINAYGRPGDDYRFYEINPQVERLARNHFTYLSDGYASSKVIIGDGRISLARELLTSGSIQFDVLVVDAFNGDAIPVHLLTREAVDLYWEHLNEDGILALHITNFHLNLLNVAIQLAEHSGRKAFHILDDGDNYYENSNDWVLITNNEKFIGKLRKQPTTVPKELQNNSLLWTDNFSNLFDVLIW